MFVISIFLITLSFNFVVPAIIFCIFALKRKKVEQAFNEVEEEMEFLAGQREIPEEKIQQKFFDVLICYQIEKKNIEGSMKILDTSQYEKNHLIGLTYFVQPQAFDELKTQLGPGARPYKTKRGEEFLMQSFVPNCTVYQLKDGRWLWRQERR